MVTRMVVRPSEVDGDVVGAVVAAMVRVGKLKREICEMGIGKRIWEI